MAGLEDNLTLNNLGSGGTAHVFALVERSNKKTRRHDMTTSLAEPRDLVVDHQPIPASKQTPAAVRNLFSVVQKILDSNGVLQTQTVNITVTETISPVWTDAIREDNIGYASDLARDDQTRQEWFVGKS